MCRQTLLPKYSTEFFSNILVWCWNGGIEHENYINAGYYNRLPVDVNQSRWVCLETIRHGMSFVLELPFASIAEKKNLMVFELHIMGKIFICAVSLTWIFPPCYLLSNHITFFITARTVSPSVCQWNQRAIYCTSPDPLNQDQERGRPKLNLAKQVLN